MKAASHKPTLFISSKSAQEVLVLFLGPMPVSTKPAKDAVINPDKKDPPTRYKVVCCEPCEIPHVYSKKERTKAADDKVTLVEHPNVHYSYGDVMICATFSLDTSKYIRGGMYTLRGVTYQLYEHRVNLNAQGLTERAESFHLTVLPRFPISSHESTKIRQDDLIFPDEDFSLENTYHDYMIRLLPVTDDAGFMPMTQLPGTTYGKMIDFFDKEPIPEDMLFYTKGQAPNKVDIPALVGGDKGANGRDLQVAVRQIDVVEGEDEIPNAQTYLMYTRLYGDSFIPWLQLANASQWKELGSNLSKVMCGTLFGSTTRDKTNQRPLAPDERVDYAATMTSSMIFIPNLPEMVKRGGFRIQAKDVASVLDIKGCRLSSPNPLPQEMYASCGAVNLLTYPMDEKSQKDIEMWIANPVMSFWLVTNRVIREENKEEMVNIPYPELFEFFTKASKQIPHFARCSSLTLALYATVDDAQFTDPKKVPSLIETKLGLRQRAVNVLASAEKHKVGEKRPFQAISSSVSSVKEEEEPPAKGAQVDPEEETSEQSEF